MAEKKKKTPKKKSPVSIREFIKNMMKPIEGKGLATNMNTKKLLKKVDKS